MLHSREHDVPGDEVPEGYAEQAAHSQMAAQSDESAKSADCRHIVVDDANVNLARPVVSANMNGKLQANQGYREVAESKLRAPPEAVASFRTIVAQGHIH